jgi:hypothetical protein
VLLETTSSSNEDGSRIWLRTPPGAAEPVQSNPLIPLRREIVADSGCAKLLAEVLGNDPSGFQVVRADIGWMLSTGSASTLGRSTIVVSPVLANGMSASEAVEQLRECCQSSPPPA